MYDNFLIVNSKNKYATKTTRKYSSKKNTIMYLFLVLLALSTKMYSYSQKNITYFIKLYIILKKLFFFKSIFVVNN